MLAVQFLHLAIKVTAVVWHKVVGDFVDKQRVEAIDEELYVTTQRCATFGARN